MNNNKPFKVQKLDDPSVVYPHLTDYVPPQKYIPQKPNIKVSRTQSVIRKVPHMVDQYERQECIERFEDLKNRIQVKVPFKCPKNHIIQTQKPSLQDTNAFAEKILIKNLNQLQIKEQSIQKKQQYQQLKAKATQIFNRNPKSNTQKSQKFGFDKSIFQDIPNMQKLLNIKISPKRKSTSSRKKKEQTSKGLSNSQKKLENIQLSQSLLNINNPIGEQNNLKQNASTITQKQLMILDVPNLNQEIVIKFTDSNNKNINSTPTDIPPSLKNTEKVQSHKAITPKANTVDTQEPCNQIIQNLPPNIKPNTPKTANTPKANIPNISQTNSPKIKPNTPQKTDTPKGNTPKANTPKGNAPKPNTPKAYTPKANTPKANTPKGNTPKNGQQQIFKQNSQFSEERKEGSQTQEAVEETKSQSIRKGSQDRNRQLDNCEVVVTVVRNGGRILKTEQSYRPNSAQSKTPSQQVFPLKKTKSYAKTTKNNEAIDISQFKKYNNANQPKQPKQQIKQKKFNKDRPKSAIGKQVVQSQSNRPKSVQKVNQINKIEISELKQEIKNKTESRKQNQADIQTALVNSECQKINSNLNSNREESPQKILESFLNSQLQESQLQLQLGESKLQDQLSLTVSQVSEQPSRKSRFIKKQN